jgi:hypothetical protein
LLTALFIFALNACGGKDYNQQELVVVSRILWEANPLDKRYSDTRESKIYGRDGYNIGLSRNGKEPIEYIWRAEDDAYGYGIINAKIGDRGTIYLREWAKQRGMKLPRPNPEEPPIIGVLGEVYWEKYDEYSQELIVVNKVPRGAFAGEKMPPEFSNVGWYEIGLSRNGKEPIEYIWRVGNETYSYTIMNAEIGERGTVCLNEEGKYLGIKLPQPSAEKPPVIGALGEVYWKKAKTASP